MTFFLAFWFLLAPKFILNYFTGKQVVPNGFGFHPHFILFDHGGVLLLHMIDSRYNMIEFNQKHFCLMNFILQIFTFVNCYTTRKAGVAMYWTNDWINRPFFTFCFVEFMNLGFGYCTFIFLTSQNKKKIAQYKADANSSDLDSSSEET